MQTLSAPFRLLLLVGVVCWLLAALSTPVQAVFTPESPEVKAAIQRGVRWVESANDPRLGAKALIGLVLIKQGLPATHPRVVEAIGAIQKVTNSASDPNRAMGDNYSIGLSAIFLLTLDPSNYRSDIAKLLEILAARQKPHGGWGYPERPTGDTSMTQYAVLALWEARQAGFDVSQEMVESVTDWLLRTQDPSGCFGYQGVVAPSAVALVAQTEMRPSLAAAGLGSVYVCADTLGLVKPIAKKKEGLPALKEVPRVQRAVLGRIDSYQVDSAKVRGNHWLESNSKVDEKVPRVHYFLYALERYWSFREAAEGRSPSAPPWYHVGAKFLLESQKDDGSWFGDNGMATTQPSVPDTCFGLLFLLRSQKKSIEKVRGYGPGVLVGGKGLPKGTAAVELRGGQIVAKPLAGPGQELIAALDNTGSPEHEQALASLAALPANEARQLVSQNESKLRELLEGASVDARLAAVQALANSDDMNNVPTLIYALGDVDSSVALAARDGLRRISRRFDNFGMPNEFNEAQRTEAIRQWKNWYRAIRPDAEFED